jgi:hypothetical protein
MYRLNAMRIPRPQPADHALPAPPAPDALSAAADAAAAEDARAHEAAATLACRASIGGETMGADGKAAIVLSLLGIMFTVLARFGPELGFILRHGLTKTGVVRVTCAVMLLGFAGFAMCAVVQAFRTIIPRFRKDKPSLAFFAEIAGLEREAYFAKVESMTMQQAVAEIMRYNHTAATICAEKYKHLGRSLRCFEAASACWLVLILVLVFKSLYA